jgi:D-sedoheptulose 7-phosphate isomerase
MIMENYIENYLMESQYILSEIDTTKLDQMIQAIARVKKNRGRIFFLGVGGSAANASHAVNDFRKIARIECYAPTDNVAELTARTNDDGWRTVFDEWLEVSRINSSDVVFVLSVGGGSMAQGISENLCFAIKHANKIDLTVLAIVGSKDGYAARNSDICIVIPCVDVERRTPHTESMQSLLLHLIVTHPSVRG